MKPTLCLLLLFLGGCTAKPTSDNEIISKTLGYDFVYIWRSSTGWDVDFGDFESIKYSGKGNTLTTAYENALKHKTIRCEIK